MMASNKKTVDVIGSIDDYGHEPLTTDPQTRVVEDDEWCSPKVITMGEGIVLSGDEERPVKADPSFIVGENRWGDKQVWPRKPFCVHCSPAAKKPDDDEMVASFDEYGAERTTSRRDGRLMGLSPSQYYAFTLKETPDGVICKKCGKSPDDDFSDTDERPQAIQHEVIYETASFDTTKPMLGIRVDEGLFRYPASLVSFWVESLDFDTTKIHVLRKSKIYSIDGKTFLKRAIYEEGNSQWLLNPDYCLITNTLEGEIKDNELRVKAEIVKEWRLTALPLDLMIVGEESEGRLWGITQGDFLKQGYIQGDMWVVKTEVCGNHLVGLKHI